MTAVPRWADAAASGEWAPVLVRGGAEPDPAHGGPDVARLTRARRAAGLSVRQLAHALHVSRATVSCWERGDRGVARHHWPLLGVALGMDAVSVAAMFAGRPPARLDGVALPSLQTVRRATGLTQRTVAARLGVAPTTVSTWESRGARVPVAAVPALARVLGATPAALAADPPHPRPELRPLRAARAAAGMTVREAAALLGVSPCTLGRYESGERRTPVAVLHRMARVYRLPPAHLLRLSSDIAPLPPGPRWTLEDLPRVIRGLRTAAGLSKVELGRALDRSGQAVAGWETGRTRPTAATCRRLERVFALPAGSLPR